MEWITPSVTEHDVTVDSSGPGQNYAHCGSCSLSRCSSSEEVNAGDDK